MRTKDLKAHKMNPRKISEKTKTLLKKSLEKFGDLGGIVFNEKTGSLVGGHQRSKALDNATIKIINKYDVPTKSGTVADGFAMIGDEKFAYRVVSWDKEMEMEALIAANKIHGEWDTGLLKMNLIDFPKIDLDMTGFDLAELKSMNIEIPKFDITSINSLMNTNPITEILGQESDDEMTDEEYLNSEEQSSEVIDRERLPNNTVYEKKEPEVPGPITDVTNEVQAAEENPFDEFEEKIETKNDKQLIVIDCHGSVEIKNKLKEKLRTDDLEKLFGVKIF